MRSMKLKQLESALGEVDSFEDPKDIIDCSIGDFGCGPGILSIGASLMGSANITGFDVDEDALETCWVNLRKMEIGNVDLIQSDIQSIQLANSFDTVVMNPPFGTRNSGIDSAFVLKGMEYSNVVYSLHKTSTREVIAELRYALPKAFKFHKSKSKDIEVDLYRFSHVN